MAMDKTRILPGELLVSKGALKINSSLPEVGLKDVVPNGSWLEQKQVQAALDNRKQLIELERIEKSGVLSHAEWREELMLAEVTQKVGGYWQYIGHNVGKQLFLNPEEALFLMEVNCLLLKYNDVKVSLQQAYSLLLRGKISLMPYKVYASLSRLGYRVYRHQAQEPTEYEKKMNLPCSSKADIIAVSRNESQSKVNGEDCTASSVGKQDGIPFKTTKTRLKSISCVPEDQMDLNINQTVVSCEPSSSKKTDSSLNKSKISKYIQHKILKLKSRKYKTTNSINLDDCFENIPSFTNNPVVSIAAPERRYLPGKMKLQCSSYILNVEKIRTKSTAPEVTPTTSSTPHPSMNVAFGSNVRRIHPPQNFPHSNGTSSFNLRFAQADTFRYSGAWRPPANMNYFQLNMTFQKPHFIYAPFGPRVILHPFLHPYLIPMNERVDVNYNRNRKRTKDQSKKEHFDCIQKFATQVKKSILELRVSDQNVFKLRQLIQSYNTKYKTRVRLSDDFTIVVDENITETIELEDDDEQAAKRTKKDENEESFNDKLRKLQHLANKLKCLESKNDATSGHRRLFAKLMKRFNSSYNVDYYLNDNYDVINRNDLTLHSSSSDVDEVVETVSKPTTSKKLRNPFSILKQISDKQKRQPFVSTSINEEDSSKSSFKYDPITEETFKNGWLPDKTDFGRAEIISNNLARQIIDIRKEEFLFDFMKIQPEKFNSWLDVKISFLHCLQETSELFNYGDAKRSTGTHRRIESLAKPEDFTDAATVLKKLSVIENNKEVAGGTNLTVDFDVYNRDVQNFKKSNRPSPHFRVICIEESSILPSGADVACLHAKYKDNVTIMFAVVGTGSISYLQVNPLDLPIYIPSNNTV
ncbi:uncharacterized protein Tsen54 [Epargyreus clarus]|uniref:uncharacterized protein Tsen54 n=1 Tax=Epargyreus clarus TaxID=520877 RepID=UPI003C2E7858